MKKSKSVLFYLNTVYYTNIALAINDGLLILYKSAKREKVGERKKEKKESLFPSGFEPGTSHTWGEVAIHYTTKRI